MLSSDEEFRVEVLYDDAEETMLWWRSWVERKKGTDAGARVAGEAITRSPV